MNVCQPVTEDVITEIVDAIAEANRMEAEELDFRLYDYIDPDVLVELASMERGQWEFTFQVEDHYIRFTHEGRLFVDGVARRHNIGKCK